MRLPEDDVDEFVGDEKLFADVFPFEVGADVGVGVGEGEGFRLGDAG